MVLMAYRMKEGKIADMFLSIFAKKLSFRTAHSLSLYSKIFSFFLVKIN